jgi:hypothetical protein
MRRGGGLFIFINGHSAKLLLIRRGCPKLKEVFKSQYLNDVKVFYSK